MYKALYPFPQSHEEICEHSHGKYLFPQQVAGITQPLDNRIIKRIHELVVEGAWGLKKLVK